LLAQIGASFRVEQSGAGAITIAGDGVSVLGETVTTSEENQVLEAIKVAADTWTVISGSVPSENFWQRNTTTLSPATAGDRVEVTAEDNNGAIKGIGSAKPGVAGSSSSSYGGSFSSSSGSGLLAQSSTGTGATVISNSGTALSAVSTSGVALVLQRSGATTNTVETVAEFKRVTSGTAASGIGGQLRIFLENGAGGGAYGVDLIGYLTDVTNTAEDGAFGINLLSGGSSIRRLTLTDDGTLWTPMATIGDVSGGDYTAIEADGTIRFVGDATVFRDELNQLITKRLVTGADKVVVNDAEGSVTYKSTAELTDYTAMSIQLNHDRKLGSAIYPHLHWWQSTTNMPNWLIQYRWQIQGGAKVTDWTYLPYDSHAVVWSSGTINQITKFGGIAAPEGDGISDIVQFRLIRDVDNDSTEFGDEETSPVDQDAVNFDIHIEVDTIGSREEYVK
jgi:hypothetical protein